MNVMLASVTERTEEVGLRKAVGARPADVLLQFLVESVMLCLVGGVLGIALAWSIAAGVSYFVDALTLTVRWDAILLATAVSTIIGVTFGVLPANRAARMDPIDALRTE
jgi:putative ABC transport system permease protein